MRFLMSFLTVSLLAVAGYTQNPSPVRPAHPCRDSVMTGKNMPAGETGPMAGCPHDKRLFPGHGMKFKRDNMSPEGDKNACSPLKKGHWRRYGRHETRCFEPLHPACAAPVCCAMLLFGVILWAIINILLTIIVSVDMTKNGRFNGLWIPVLLIAGIPGSMIYALFRIGDRISGKAAG